MNFLRIWRYLICLLVLILSLGRCASAQKNQFDLKCHPFQALEMVHPIDSSCPSADGNATDSTSGHALQNVAKNNFCAGNTFVDIKHEDFVQLQQSVEKLPGYPTWNNQNYPGSRDSFKNMGGKLAEGAAVRYTAYVFEAHAADTSGGESVNCNQAGVPPNDIHIALVHAPTITDECETTTAEMSPHFRPTSWDAQRISSQLAAFIYDASQKKLVPNPAATHNLVRVTGQLMFDAPHKPCTNGKRGGSDPARVSLWEVHPVYEMDVCTKTNAGSCADSDWQPLDRWLGTPTGKGHKPPKTRKPTTTP